MRAGRQVGRVQGITERFGAKATDQRVAFKIHCRKHHHEAETARIVIGDGCTVPGVKDDVIVFGIGAGVVCKIAWHSIVTVWLLDGEASGHAQMHDQGLPAIEVGNEIFGTAGQCGYAAAGDALGKPVRQRETQVWAALLKANNTLASQHRREAAADRFNLGKLRQVAIVSSFRESLV